MATAEPGNGLNKVTASPTIKHSNYDLSRKVGITPVFGRNTPFLGIEVVPDDGPITIQPSCDTRSYTLKAPVFGTVKKHVAAYQVPVQAILPMNADKIVKNSSHGTDVQGDSFGSGLVPALDGVNTVISNFASQVFYIFDSYVNDVFAELMITPTDIVYLNAAFDFILRGELFFSNGNLISHLGTHLGHVLNFRYTPDSTKPSKFEDYSFDQFSQLMLSTLLDLEFSVTDNAGDSSSGYGKGASHIRRCLDFCRSHVGPFSFTIRSGQVVYLKGIEDFSTYWSMSSFVEDEDSAPFNYGRCVSYQLINAHYYTNDRIDYINTAELYREYIGSLLRDFLTSLAGDSYPSNFIYNSISCQYDYLAGYYINKVIGYINSPEQDFYTFVYPILNAVFGFNYSLRYLDYFAGARPHNLAISGPNTPTNVQVDNNTVSVTNITKSLVAQRFLNAVARVPSNIEDYSEKILGRKPSYDWHNPKYLFSYEYDIFTQEIENTGTAQVTDPNSVTAVMRGSARDLSFTVSVDRHSFIICIENFDIRRFYYTTQDKNTMAVDRFDMFVPELQYLGDQELKLSELVAGSRKDIPFGYQLRDMQFKQSFDECCGGFVENLPGWLYKFDISKFNLRGLQNLYIGPNFIRCVPEEIDEFYLSLTGLTLASYFHFIELWDIKISANRPMIAAPQIL